MRKWIISIALVGVVIAGLYYYFTQKVSEHLYAYIPNADEGSIAVVDTSTDKMIKKIKVDNQLSDGIEVSRDGKFIFAGNYTKGELIVIDAKTGRVEKKLETGKNLHGIDLTPDGKYLYLASGDFKEGEEYNYISVVETKTLKMDKEIRTNSKSPAHIDFSHDGSLAYVSNILSNDVSLINTKTNKIIATIPVGTVPNEVEPSKDDKYLFVANVADGTVSFVDILKKKTIKTIKVGEGTHGLALSPDGKYLYAANRSSNDLIKLNIDKAKIVAKVVTGKTANHVSFVPNSDKLYVTNKDSNDLTVIDAKSVKIIKKISLGKTPHEVSFGTGNN